MLDIQKTILEKYPDFPSKPGGKKLIQFLQKLTYEKEINQFIEENQHLRGFAFLDKCLNHFNFSYQVNHRALDAIPSEGRVIMVANHPIGSLDGLALLKMIRSIRPDVRIVANELLSHVEPFQSLFLSVDNMSSKANHKAHFKAMIAALENEEAVIIFPAGEVSRIRPNGVRDSQWKHGFLKLAKKTQSPILPIYIDARNSILFYGLSTLYKPLGTLMLVQEMFNKKNQQVAFHVGALVPWKSLADCNWPYPKMAKYFRKHIYRLNDPQVAAENFVFKTENTLAHPVNRTALKKDLKNGELLGETADGKKIFLFDYEADSAVMQEIGRLRELTFRTVEEGTGDAFDLDKYDASYRHLVLWDEEDLEIVGAYRLGDCRKIVEEKGLSGLYTSTLFTLKPEMTPYLNNALELGRSFVQPRYWGKRSLDYLWYGIGAYVNRHPETTYLFGPVSLSDAFPTRAKELIVAFFQTQMGSKQDLAIGKRPFIPSPEIKAIAEQDFDEDYNTSYKKLNILLSEEGVKVPTLFKQYADLCEPGGCRFIDFSVDPDFNDCIDSLILIEIDKIKPKKQARYLKNNATTLKTA
ncbi:GNAT family N-acetyltransferase [Hydrogenovibrio sp. SC-1]|uniref:lysophospholipid acyltransferase family protein n=1 Tax=Hydrogenovibrio sp. SC-1 TaxID=2065820 RepID=UPI000C7E3663|nr:GNAT family N-acyltransferase [Hydrogenovibrio sp. SC-1]PLA74549.1 GNAT family N-acetyltransferase [Hydrogenovibrio sp. SC-1]